MDKKGKSDRPLGKRDRSPESSLPTPSDYILDWFSIFHGWDFIIAPATEDKSCWKTFSRYPLTPLKLYYYWLDENQLVGVSFQTIKDGQTRYAMLDIDIGSAFHPYQSEERFRTVLAVMEDMGLCRYLIIQSSALGGLHLYFPFSEPLPCLKLAIALKNAFETAGLEVKSGQLEIFPNVKTLGSVYHAHRLPLQLGSFVLDEDFQPVHHCLTRLIQEWELVANHQDLERLKQWVIRVQPSYQSGKDGLQWKKELEQLMERGWTASGQTNQMIMDVCRYGRVFLGKEWDDVETWALKKLVSLPGYQEFCGHKREIRRRVKEWVKTNRRSNRYYPYKSAGKKTKVSSAPNNEERGKDALERIEKAIATIKAELGELPVTVRERQILICRVAQCSAATLRKYLYLWHPDYEVKTM